MMKNLGRLSFLLLALSFLYSCGNSDVTKENNEEITENKENKEASPNIVFILSDDQSWTDYGFTGHQHIETPNLDKLANESLTFTRGYVPISLCNPSLASIVTGLHPRQHNVLGNDRIFATDKKFTKEQKLERRAQLSENYKSVISDFEKLTTLPDMLKERGYLSFQTGKWWQGNFASGGFDYGMTHGDPKRGGRHGDYGLQIGRKGMDTLYSYIDLAIEKEKPFFLWYAPMMPHGPHTPPDSLFQKYLKRTSSEHVARYWAMCEWFDYTCGQLTDYIDQKGLTENTIFVYVCDNGWVQNEDNTTYDKVSKRSPFDLGMRTPIMFKWKGKVTPGIDTTSLVSSIDMIPTVLDLIGMEQPSNLHGINVVDNEKLQNRDAIFGEIYDHDFNSADSCEQYKIAITNPYKLIVPHKVNKSKEKVRLYNIYQDPYEKVNLADQHPEIVEQLSKKIADFWTKQ